MRVLIATGIYPPETGGPATFVPALAAHWCARGWHVTVVTYGDGKTTRSNDWNVVVVSRFGGALIRYLRYAWRVAVMAKGHDVVFLQGPFSEGLPGTIGAALAGRPTVLRVPGDFAWEGMNREQLIPMVALETFIQSAKPIKWRLIFWLESWVARCASHVVTPSRYLQCLADAWGVRDNRKHVIYNTVNVERQISTRNELRTKFGFDDRETILFVNTRGVPWKRVDFLLDVLKELPACYRLVHVGEGPEIQNWQKKAAILGIASRVKFKGRVPHLEVQALARAADIFLLPSLYEGFPHVAVEAACEGLPCLLSDQGGNPEVEKIYPERIQILPYADHNAWKLAIQTTAKTFEPISPKPFAEVAIAYAQIVELAK